jgi:hypothetical protein
MKTLSYDFRLTNVKRYVIINYNKIKEVRNDKKRN